MFILYVSQNLRQSKLINTKRNSPNKTNSARRDSGTGEPGHLRLPRLQLDLAAEVLPRERAYPGADDHHRLLVRVRVPRELPQTGHNPADG